MYLRWREVENKTNKVFRAEILSAYRHPVTRRPHSRVTSYVGSIKKTDLVSSTAQQQFVSKFKLKLTDLRLPTFQRKALLTKLEEHISNALAELRPAIGSVA